MVGGNRAIHEAAIAQVLNASGKVKGVAFAVTGRHMLTCAHVVNAVIEGRSEKQADRPQETVKLSFPWLGVTVEAKVVYWRAPSDDRLAAEEDIAGLELLTAVPGMQAVEFADYRDGDRQFSVLGYPVDRPLQTGVSVEGKILGSISLGWTQIQGTTEQGGRVERGFSGAPVCNLIQTHVLGMVVAEFGDEAAKTAAMLSTSVLEPAMQFLKSQSPDRPSLIAPPAPSPLAVIKRQGIQRQLNLVLNQIQALYEKLALDRSGSNGILIQAEIEQLEQKAETLAKQIDDLK
jgi:V8-like Glu-specific endopeptidase